MVDDVTTGELKVAKRVIEYLEDEVISGVGRSPSCSTVKSIIDKTVDERIEDELKDVKTVNFTFYEMMRGTDGEQYEELGYEPIDIEWVEGGIIVTFETTNQE